MANARPDRPTSFEEGASEGEEDDNENNVNKSSFKEEPLSNNKQNGVPPARNVDRYGFMGGDQYTSPEEIPRVTLDIIRKREVKWVEMFENWEKWMTKRFKRVRARCRKGIPPSLRARAWQYLCGSKFLMDQNQGKFEEYLHKAGDPKWIEDIHKDLHRQFPLHEIFAMRGGHGQEDLFRILKAYTIHNPQDGYCQAQGPIAAVLLMHMPAEQAFWCLVSICEKYLPGYYSPGLEAVHIDGDVLFGLLKKSSPLIYKHLKKQKIEPILYMTEWFMCIFSRTLPWTAVLRVWDMFFCEGVKVMFRIALVLFKLTLGTPEKLVECPTLYETMEKLRHIPHEIIDGEFISKESLKLNVDEKDMEKEHQYQITKRRKAQSSAKTEIRGSKKKRKEKQFENVPEEKKRDNAHLTFWKLQNKFLMKETNIENAGMTTVPKSVKDEQLIPQSTFPVLKSEPQSSKKLQTTKMQEVEMAKILAKEAFTAKVQQTLKPVLSDAKLPAKVELLASDAPRESSSEFKLEQKSASAQTSPSDEQLSLSTGNERLSSQAKDQYISSCVQSATKRTLLESSGTNQPEELKIHSADENQLQQPVEVSRQEEKLQLNFADVQTLSDVQLVSSSNQKDEKAEIHQINVAAAASLEPGQLLTCPILQSCSQSLDISQKTENEHSCLDNQFKPSDIDRTSLDILTAEESLQTEVQTLDMYKSESQSPSSSRHFIQKSVHDPKCLDKTQYPNLPASCPIKSNWSSEDVTSSGEVSEELEPSFVNTLLIESDAMECQHIQQLIANKISKDTNHAAHQQVDYFEDEMPPKKDLASDTMSGILQQVSSAALDTAFGKMQPQQQSPVEQSIHTKQQDEADFNLVYMHKVLQPKNSTADNEIEIPSTLVDQNQKFSIEPLSVTSEQVLHSAKVNLKANLAASQQVQSSQPLSTEIVKVKPQRLSSTLQMEDSSISPEFTKLPSDTIVVKKQSVPAVKQVAVESLLIKRQCPLPLTEIMSVTLCQHSSSAIDANSTEPCHLNLISPKEYPKPEENQIYAVDLIENQSSSKLDEHSKTATVDLVDAQKSQNSPDSMEHTRVTEQLVQQLSFQTVQLSNKDDTLIPVGSETNLPLKNDSEQMKETHI